MVERASRVLGFVMVGLELRKVRHKVEMYKKMLERGANGAYKRLQLAEGYPRAAQEETICQAWSFGYTELVTRYNPAGSFLSIGVTNSPKILLTS
jgi:hypothetical protein